MTGPERKTRRHLPPSIEVSEQTSLNPKGVAKQYDQIAGVFKDHRLNEAEGFNVFVFGELLAEMGPYIDDARILDFGCGPGVVTEHYATLGAREVLGVDVSKEMISLAQMEYQDRFPKVQFEFSYFFNYHREYFDVIVATYVLDHMDDVELAKEMDRWKQTLKPGGTIFVVGPHEDRHQRYWEESGKEGDFPEGWHLENWSGANSHYIPTYWRRTKSWIEQFESAGLTINAFHEPVSSTAHNPELLEKYPDIAEHYKQKRFIIWEMQVAKAPGD